MKNSEQIEAWISQLTLEEKAGLCSGRDQWFTKTVERLGIPNVRTSDGPHGLRTQSGETNSLAEKSSEPAVCFPTGSALGASFDRELLREVGAELGKEAQALGVNVLLGPGINHKRSPLCGRNFEYLAEDPAVSGALGAAYVQGLQSEGVGACVKHFFANSQEHRRMDNSSEMDERTMREIYLTAFETVVKRAKPWSIMASYNKINGTYSTENTTFLTGLLRGEWGFDGAVISDWGAVHDRAAAAKAGCDLTMPAEDTDTQLVKAVQDGTLPEEALNECCRHVLDLVCKTAENKRPQVFDYERGHALARKAAQNAMVLLKNDGILPLGKNRRVAFIGGFAEAPRYQGGGSSHINSFKTVSAAQTANARGLQVQFVQGYPGDGLQEDAALLAQAVEAAKEAEVAVVFVGLPDQMESEGVDRRHLDLPAAHNALVEAVCAANPNTVVVLHNGAPVLMPWASKPKAILECYLGGQAVGEAAVDILYGDVNPSGHLAETFPLRLQDTPAYLFYFGEGDRTEYREGVFTGYRYYASREMPVAYPFGHGLSYTSFAYSDLHLDKTAVTEGETVTATVTVTNTGNRMGKALVQLYVAPPRKEVLRPVRELKGFEKVELAPGESREVSFALDRRSFAHWAELLHDWRTESGVYQIEICENAQSVLLSAPLTVTAVKPLRPIHYTMDMAMGDFAKTAAGRKALDENIGYMIRGMAAIGYIPKEGVAAMEAMGGGKINLATVERIAQHMGANAGGGSGVQTLFSQPLSMLANFLPPEKTAELQQLLQQFNEENGFAG